MTRHERTTLGNCLRRSSGTPSCRRDGDDLVPMTPAPVLPPHVRRASERAKTDPAIDVAGWLPGPAPPLRARWAGGGSASSDPHLSILPGAALSDMAVSKGSPATRYRTLIRRNRFTSMTPLASRLPEAMDSVDPIGPVGVLWRVSLLWHSERQESQRPWCLGRQEARFVAGRVSQSRSSLSIVANIFPNLLVTRVRVTIGIDWPLPRLLDTSFRLHPGARTGRASLWFVRQAVCPHRRPQYDVRELWVELHSRTRSMRDPISRFHGSP